ncbi:MAG TPA: lysophospholipid acyltransferase family protein [Candidatus Dormibacteraeota bacterium]|nr:lysophospholipid acyltransferase family protein [Candidatus Dormibacteraeota bacterium]
MYAFMRGLMRFIVRVYLVGRFHCTGRERVPRTGPLLVCANHASTIDPPLLPAWLPRSDSWSMAKAEWFARPTFTAWLFTRYHAFPIVRHSPDRRGLKRALGVVRDGGALIVYPEGHRVESGGMWQAEPGAGFIGRATGAPVQPVALVGTRDCFPKGARWPRRARVEVRIGPCIRIRDRRPDGRRVENQEAADAIMLAIAEMLPAPARGHYADLDALRERLAGVWEPAGASPSPPDGEGRGGGDRLPSAGRPIESPS